MFKYCYIICLLLLINYKGFTQTFKPAANPEKILAELKQVSQSTNSIQADFQEEKFLAVLNNTKKSSGIFYYQKKDKMRWEQQLPFSYVILINSGKLRVLDAGNEKNVGSAGKMASQIKELMIGLVNGDFQQNKAFKQSVAENSDFYQITLIPVNRRLKNIYQKISLTFSKSSLHLKELTFFEKGDDKSVMKFKNEKINQPIAARVFLEL